MHKLPIIRISLALSCALPLAATAQEGLQLKPQRSLGLTPPSDPDKLPIFLEADQVRGHAEKEIEAEGNVKLRRGGQSVFAEWMRYDLPSEEIQAAGNVRLEQDGTIVKGERLQYDLRTDRGYMEKPRYVLTPAPAQAASTTPAKRRFSETDARGRAERLLFEGPRRYRAEQAEYTTCEPIRRTSVSPCIKSGSRVFSRLTWARLRVAGWKSRCPITGTSRRTATTPFRRGC